MFHVLTWFVVCSLLTMWSLACWAFNGVVGWTMAQAGVLASGGLAGQSLSLPAWLAPWVPPDVAYAAAEAVAAFAPAIQSLLGQVPALSGMVGVVVWIIWGLGAALLVVLGLVVSGLIAAAKRRQPPQGGPGVGTGGSSWAAR